MAPKEKVVKYGVIFSTLHSSAVLPVFFLDAEVLLQKYNVHKNMCGNNAVD